MIDADNHKQYYYSMKTNPIAELTFLVILAFLLSSVLYAVIAFTLASFDMFSDSAKVSLNSVTGVFAGLIIGYRLRDMVLGATKSKKKKK